MTHRTGYMRAAAVGVQLAVVVACAGVGWKALHQLTPQPKVKVQGAPPAPLTGLGSMVAPLRGSGAVHRAVPSVGPPSLSELMLRVNRDDALLYQGQWRSAHLLGEATRSYLERHIVPLLLAAARGGMR
ncbi:MAG: hypothetical protein ABR598_06850 [Candidatus Dormibacteria bacterium]